jgi:DNA polymerase elongation subunit (family B)
VIYNCYVADNRFCVDLAKSDSEVVTRRFPFSMKLGLLSDEPGYEKNRTSQTMDELYTGKKLRVYEFASMMKYKGFLKDLKDKRPVFGDIDPIYHCLSQHFKEPLPVFNPRFYTLDIEVYSKNEFPEPDKAEYVMNLVTICDYQNQKYYTWGLKPFENKSEFDVEYSYCRSEIELMESLIQFFETENIKCMTGWNTLGFDVPYIINRFRKFTQKSEIISDYVENNINLYGKNKSFKTIQVIDYMELYKKFKDKKLERYSLDFVSVYEGFEGKKKLGKSLAEASDDNWDDYVLYNIIDNYKIVQLENKLKYIKQAFSMANDNRCLPTDVYSPVKMWDAAVYFELYHRGILVPPLMSEPPQKLVGGYVGQPELAIHKYVSVFDIGSSYPHQIMQFNISPECLIGERKLHDDLKAIRARFTPSVDEMKKCPDPQFQKEWQGFTKDLWKKFSKNPEQATPEELNIYRVKFNVYRFSLMAKEDMADVHEVLVRHNVTMTANLQFYRKDRQGIFPELMQRFFAIRNVAKRNVEALEFHIDAMKKQLGIRIEEEKLSSFDDVEDDEELEENEEELLEEVLV